MVIFETLGSAMTNSLGWIGDVVGALLSSDGALKELWPLAMVGISFGVIRMGIGYIKDFAWGF